MLKAGENIYDFDESILMKNADNKNENDLPWNQFVFRRSFLLNGKNE